MKARNILLYYLALIVILLLWRSESTAPPMALRVIYLLAVMAPSFTRYRWIVPAALSCIWMITINGPSYSFMPTEPYLYIFTLLLCSFTSNKERTILFIDIKEIISLLLYVTLINLVTGADISNMSYCLVVVLLFCVFFDIDLGVITKYFSWAFMIFSIVISCFALENRSEILMSSISGSSSFERLSWVDPNYMGMQIGFGSIIGLANLFFPREVGKWEKSLSIIVLVLSIPSILLTGSRGASLSIMASIAVFVLISNTKFYRRIFTAVLITALLYFLFSNHYMDLLIHRINNDDGTGADRTLIWAEKIKYFREKNPLAWLFGLGHQQALKLNLRKLIVGFHNDYLAALCSYGVTGLMLLMNFLLTPLKKVKKQTSSKSIIIGYTSYILLCMMTLEPFTAGVISFFIFILYMYLISINSLNEED